MKQLLEKSFLRLRLFNAASCTFDGGDVDAADDYLDFLFHRKQFEDLLICHEVHDSGADLCLDDGHFGPAEVFRHLIDDHGGQAGIFYL